MSPTTPTIHRQFRVAAGRGPTRRRTAAVAALLALVIPLAGCGTRMSAERIAAADGSGSSSQAAGVDDGALGADAPVIAPTTTDTGAAAVVPRAAPSGTTDTTATGVTATGGTASTTAGAAASGVKGGGTASGANVATGPNAPCARSLAPMVLGQTGAVAGIIGASIGNLRTGVALWVKAVNAAGGVQCHPVQMYQMDDGSDPARVTSNLNELVKNKKAIAIVGAGLGTTLAAGKRFAEQNKIPFVGGDLAETGWYGSQWMFPQGGSPLADYGGALKESAATVNGTRAGLMYCVEAAVCGIINSNFEALTKSAGLEIGTRKVTSLTAPDYTAECQAMKAAEVDVVFFALDGSAQSRAARSCRALGLTTPIATSALGISDQAAKDLNLRALGVYLGTNNAPFTASDTPGGKEFQTAYARFAPGSAVDQNVMAGWASGRLFEAAVANVSDDARRGAITTELVLEGLWKVKNEKLNGIAPPLTFNRNGLPSANDCYYLLTITAAGYGSPAGSRLRCLSGLPKGF